ncbi:hypothetical protein D3C73_546000 [compost metagenome]
MEVSVVRMSVRAGDHKGKPIKIMSAISLKMRPPSTIALAPMEGRKKCRVMFLIQTIKSEALFLAMT